MAWIQDFLTLRFLVTPYIILAVYWLGALMVPLIASLLSLWVIKKLKQHPVVSNTLNGINQAATELIPHSGGLKWLFWCSVIFLFLILELFWRMLFEFLIVYYHIHEALLKIAEQS